uniref:Uncharacterized protein n=1 Tax=Nelumbo nucifera TaxID=4432 RepID=A0A822Z6N8_NELNU|nr:TPA_asm: hypothetical protein HUJ06_014576 [Nelumbo nucifera]
MHDRHNRSLVGHSAITSSDHQIHSKCHQMNVTKKVAWLPWLSKQQG